MTREEAIEKLNNAKGCPLLYDSHIEAIDMAIQALSQEPIKYWIDCNGHVTPIQQPPVTQKSGKWIEHPEIETSTPEYLMFYECSECGNKQCFCKSDIHKKRFCSNCGAKMEDKG